jgi:hypothetical protein
MLFRETIIVCCENHMKDTNTPWRLRGKFLDKAGGTFNNCQALKVNNSKLIMYLLSAPDYL